MKGATLFVIFLLLIPIEVGCATSRPPYEPFTTSREEFFSKVKTIALATFLVPSDLEDPEPIKNKYEALITAKLREAGFTVILSSEYDAVWKRAMEQMGGIFDPITGKPDEAKRNSMKMHTLRELQRTVHADVVLYPRVQAKAVKFFNGIAVWDGATESLVGLQVNNAMNRFLHRMYSKYSGTVSALSLITIIQDINGVTMYSNGGGIQLLAQLSGGSFVPVPRAELFSSEEHYTKSLNLALGSLVKNDQSLEGAKEKPKTE
jgi:hypothetical protein